MKKLLVGIDKDFIGGIPSGTDVYLFDIAVLDKDDDDEDYTMFVQANSAHHAKIFFVNRYFKGYTLDFTEEQCNDAIKQIENTWGYSVRITHIGTV